MFCAFTFCINRLPERANIWRRCLDVLRNGRRGWRTDAMGLPVGEMNPETDDAHMEQEAKGKLNPVRIPAQC